MTYPKSPEQIRSEILAPYAGRSTLSVDEISSLFKPFFEEHFRNRRSRAFKGKFSDEYKDVGNLSLQLNESPAIGIIDHELRPLVGPRLELHLMQGDGIQKTRQYLGRIARFIDGEALAEDFPVITATTFTPLIGLAEKVTDMEPATSIFVPPKNAEARLFVEDIELAHIDFMHANPGAYPKHVPTKIGAISLQTTDFVERWVNQD